MGRIVQLPPEIINKIAAGEVVERPASIVKELLENALDAQASWIKIYVEDGGKKLIKVVDNGIGILAEDLPQVIKRHTTSKIKKVEDLLNISTYGFRGEALSSIAAVSRFKISSRAKEEKVGGQLVFEGGEPLLEPYSGPVGTTVEVRDLFYNIPARKKFLKSSNTEYRHILRVIEDFAVLSPGVRFTLIKDGREVFDLLPATQKERIEKLIGVREDELLYINDNDLYFSLKVFLLHPKKLGETTRFFRIFVNKRPVEDKGIVAAVNVALEGYVPHSYKASAVVFLEVPSNYVDVNVHPRKIEVKFLNPYRVYAYIKGVVKQGLKAQINAELKVDILDKGLDFLNGNHHGENDRWEQEQRNAVTRLRETPIVSGGEGEIKLPKPSSSKQAFELTEFLPRSNASLDELTVSSEKASISLGGGEQTNVITPDASVQLQHINSIAEEEEIRQITQLLNRYILVEWESEVWIIDQHAAAERIRYESLIRRYKESKTEVQGVLNPIEFLLSQEEVEIVNTKGEILEKLGFAFSIDGNKLLLKAFPVFLKAGDIERILRDVINQLRDANFDIASPGDFKFASESKFSNLIATIACHNSIRANEKMAPEELKGMVKQLLACDVPYACPHGRRLIWILTKEDIDKQFMRI